MKTIDVYGPTDPEYERICRFVHPIYVRELSIHIHKFPDLFFGIHEGTKIIGCMGLNLEMHFDLFLKDPRLRRAYASPTQRLRIGEQSVFAVENFSVGVPLLISVVAEYAY